MPRKDGKDRGIFEHPPGSGIWYACWKDGTQIRRKKVGSKDLARAYYIKAKAQAQEDALFPERAESKARKITIAQLCAKYRPEWQTKATAAKDDHFAKWWCEKMGSRPAAQVKTAEIAAARVAKMAEEVKIKKAPVKGATANRYVSFLKRLYNLAIRDGILIANPASGRVLPKLKEQTHVKYVAEDAESVLLSHCKKDKLKRAVIVGFCTGMRAGEQFGMKRDQINFSARTIALTDTKSSETRYLAMSDRVEEALREQLASHDSEWVWPGRTGGRCDASAMGRCLKRAMQKAGIPVYSWHALRHSFGTWVTARGGDIRSLAEAMGHSSIMVTEIYTKVVASRVRGVMDLASAGTQCSGSAPSEERLAKSRAP